MRLVLLMPLVITVLAAANAYAQAAPVSGPHGTVENRWTTKRTNAPTGFGFTGRYHAVGDPAGDPPYMRRMTFYLPRGMRYDTTVPERCTASDIELKLAGASACPDGSRLGNGTVETKFMGFPSTLEVDVINNTDQMIMLARSPVLSTVTRGRISRDGGTVDFRGPTCFPSVEPPGCPIDTALQLGSSITVPPYIRRSGRSIRSYATTPSKCPKSRRWRTRVRFWWADGSRETIATRERCRRRAAGRKKH